MAQPRTGVPYIVRLSLRFAATSVGTWLMSRTLPSFDRFLQVVSGGRLTLPKVMWKAGAPVVVLTTIGAKTGKERTVPVLGVQDGEKWVVVASNWGRDRHPAWYYNLTANPEVELTYRGETGQYVAREVTGEEREDYWTRVGEVNPGLETYQERAGERSIPVMVLRPAAEDPASPAE